MISLCCVGFASLDVVCDDFHAISMMFVKIMLAVCMTVC